MNSNLLSNEFNVRRIAVIGMLSSISIVLGLTGFGFLPLPVARATIMHIPVIIGAILEGPVAGVIIGLIFGLFSIFQNLISPNILSFAFVNPLVSVLPRMLIGITAWFGSNIPFGRYNAVKIGIGAAIGSLTNSFGVLTMIYVLYAAQYAEVKGISKGYATGAIYGLAVTNGIPEAILAVVATIPVVLAVRKIRR